MGDVAPRAALHAEPGGDGGWWQWHLEPAVVLGLLGAAAVYLIATRATRRRGHAPPAAMRVASFLAGLGVLAVALIGPLDAYNDRSFTSHMLQHLAMMQLAAPLLVLGRPATTVMRALPPPLVGRALRAVAARRGGRGLMAAALSPLVVGLLFNANLVLWHLPPAYDAALRDTWVHDLEHAGFLGTALPLWWMVLGPLQRHAPAPSHAAYGLSFASCMAGGTVALALIFAPFPIYPWYRDVANPWGLTALADQRLGGLIMALGGAIYFAMLFALLWREVDRPARGQVADASG